MSTIDELRGLVERAKQYLEQTGPDHDWGCPGDDTCDCETGPKQKAVDKLVQITPALLARLAEAERVIRGEETNSDRDGPLAVLMVASLHNGEGPCSIHKSHLLDTLARMDGLRKKLAEAEARAKCAEEAVRVLGWCVRRRRERDKDETKAWLRDEVIEADWSVDANPAARAAVEGANP